MGRTNCPRCKEHRTRRSPRRGFFEETLLRLVWMRPYRCQGCDRRFFAFARPNSECGGHSYSPLARRETCEAKPCNTAVLRQPPPRQNDAYEGAVAWLQEHNPVPHYEHEEEGGPAPCVSLRPKRADPLTGLNLPRERSA
jgi:hypothetical protein